MEYIEPDEDLSKEPVNILFNPATINKKNVWDVDIVQILDLLTRILKKSDKNDLRVAGMAALTSSLIYKFKVESIFALHQATASKTPALRRNVDIEMIGIPYRHESTRAVSLDELLEQLENLIGSIANPMTRRRKQLFEPTDPPDMDKYILELDNVIGKYEDLIVKKITVEGTGLLGDIISNLDSRDRILCFFAILYMARDGLVELEQVGDDIRITLIGPAPAGLPDPKAVEGQ